MGWQVLLVREVEEWLLQLADDDPDTADLVEAAIDTLSRVGPTLGRPLVDRIKGSRLHNMKELRPASTGASEVRVLLVFDPDRRAVLLVAGDKAGDWNLWYKRNIPLAEEGYETYLAEVEAQKRKGR